MPCVPCFRKDRSAGLYKILVIKVLMTGVGMDYLQCCFYFLASCHTYLASDDYSSHLAFLEMRKEWYF